MCGVDGLGSLDWLSNNNSSQREQPYTALAMLLAVWALAILSLLQQRRHTTFQCINAKHTIIEVRTPNRTF